MNDPDRLTSHDDKTFDRDTRALILRIIVVACLGMLFWQAIIAAGSLLRSMAHLSGAINCSYAS